MKKKLLIAVLALVCLFALALGLTACNSGGSAYDAYKEAYIEANGSEEGLLSEKEWLASLKGDKGDKGEQGDDGLSAYEIYKKYTSDSPILSEKEWLESLKGDKGEDGAQGSDGLSAYEIYKKYTIDDPILSEEEWLESLKGADGENGDGFWQANPQGLAFYPQDDGTFAVAAGQSILLSEIVVPATYLGKNVTAILDNGFADCKNLKKIVIPETVTVIPENAFKNCVKLSKLFVGEQEVVGFFVFNDRYTSAIDGLTVSDYAFANTGFMSLNIADSNDNDTNVVLTVKNALPNISKIKITSALNSSTDIKFENTVSLDGSETYELDFGTYGLFKDIDIELYEGTKPSASVLNAGGVAVTADEYNFAPLTASYPVLVFTLMLNEITANGSIPTFICMDRYNQYDWNNLPYNCQIMPFASAWETTSTHAFHPLRNRLAKYIAELYSLNKNSKFNLYVGDNYCEVILEMFVANRIPESNWSATLLSDGARTAWLLSETYKVENPQARYDEMRDNFNDVKSYVYKTGRFDPAELVSLIKYPGVGVYQILECYAYVMAKENSNISWIVNRLRANENLNAIKDAAFVTEILNNVKQVYTNNLLAALTEEQAENFKKLYKFNSDMFTVAEEQNKEVIVILGTSWSSENGNLYDNIKMLVELYGTENYVYYYKGHPGYPTSQYTGRQEYFESLKKEGYEIYELDNAIAAEIILFFKPDIYMAGYETSTFDSVESHEKALLLFGSKHYFVEEKKYTYAKYFDVFASVITDKTEYGDLQLEADRTYFVIEYNNTAEYQTQIDNFNKHEIAIYDTVEKTVKYYKVSDSDGQKTFTEVDADGNPI